MPEKTEDAAIPFRRAKQRLCLLCKDLKRDLRTLSLRDLGLDEDWAARYSRDMNRVFDERLKALESSLGSDGLVSVPSIYDIFSNGIVDKNALIRLKPFKRGHQSDPLDKDKFKIQIGGKKLFFEIRPIYDQKKGSKEGFRKGFKAPDSIFLFFKRDL